MDLKRYTIGTRVDVQAVLRSCLHPNGYSRKLERVIKRKTGWIVGISKKYEGEVKRGPFGDSDCPSYFEIHRTVPVWLVRFGMTNKTEAALDEDVSLASKQSFQVPIYENPYVWSERDKESVRNFVKNQPRDKKGRWKKS